jgi:hypothetical protein
MKTNMGNIDRTIRVLFAFLFAFLYFQGIISGAWGIGLLIVSAIFSLTSLVSFCPMYAVFGISTCKRK